MEKELEKSMNYPEWREVIENIATGPRKYNILDCSMTGEDVSRYWCNNWRKQNKLPMRRRGTSLIRIKMRFEHHTTKKQKKRWYKRHTLNLFDL